MREMNQMMAQSLEEKKERRLQAWLSRFQGSIDPERLECSSIAQGEYGKTTRGHTLRAGQNLSLVRLRLSNRHQDHNRRRRPNPQQADVPITSIRRFPRLTLLPNETLLCTR